MGELTQRRADLALFPLTITAQRAAAVSYTMPFMADGYGIVVQQQQVSAAAYGSACLLFKTTDAESRQVLNCKATVRLPVR